MADLFKDILNTIDSKKYNYFDENNSEDELSDYNSYVVNKAYSFWVDTILASNEMNKYSEILSNKMQYDFYYYFIPKSRRYAGNKWKIKKEKNIDQTLENIAAYYGFSKQKAKMFLNYLTEYDIEKINNIINGDLQNGNTT